ncbi:phosphatase PAP2 family protein [Mammaliicoccus sp. Dog046]|uniref:phosphatase PAP2 family protein n=1 Tax=Mammaliicoccus sp. Dog046 TaxID=3034233 RepID=UPI002B25C04A|nr:phosphatase PAP2 family protein [Mammaliicoccus sp. Dog046]WQK85741.1 phosphatase PAP2 family protein [Mammaliicoccus sp. Dog046]
MKKDSKRILTYSTILLILIIAIITKWIYPLDHAAYSAIHSIAMTFRLYNYLPIISYIFSPVHTLILICVMLAGLFIYRKKHFLFYAVFSVSSIIIGTILKYIVQRPRPSDLIDGFSFPSLHTLTLFVAVFVFLSIYNKPFVKWIAAIFIISMMCSRVFLHAHYFSDTCASLIIVHLVYILIKNNWSRFFANSK